MSNAFQKFSLPEIQLTSPGRRTMLVAMNWNLELLPLNALLLSNAAAGF